MKKAFRALAFIVVMLIATAPSPPLIGVTGTVYNNNGLPAPGTAVTFSSLSTQVVGGVEVPPSSFTATADATGAISASLPRSLRVNVVIGRGAPMAVTLPNQASIDLSALLAAVQVPPPASLVSSLSVAPGGDYALAVANPVGQGAATLSPGNVTRLNGNPVAALVPNPGQFLVEDAGGVAWEPFSLSGDATASAAIPGQITVNHFTLSSSASAGGFKLQNLAAGAASGDSFAVGLNSINQTAAPTTDFSMNSHKLTGLLANTAAGDALSQGQSRLNHLAAATGNYALGSNRLTGVAAPAAAGDALSEGAAIGAITPAAGSFTSLTAGGTNGPALSNFNVNGAFNVKAYGAKGDASNDDAAAIQAAINAACAVSTNSASAATVYLPTGTYRHSKPLQLTCSNITLAGAGSNSSTLYPAFGYGPALMIVGSGYTGLETGSALATGSGPSMKFDGLRYWLNLRDSPTLDLNGLTAFSVEAFVKPTATTDGQIVASSGRFLASSPVTQAFSLQMVSSQLEGRLNLGGTTYIVDSGSSNTLSVNTVYHVAMSWDGSTIRIFINGTQVASRSASGTIQQAITEDVTVGPSIYDWPDGTILGNAIQGYVDSLRISRVARYTANFTAPTAKLTADSNTLGLLNFDQVQGPLVGMYTSNSLAWIPIRRTSEPNGTSEIANSGAVLNNVVLHDLGINASYGQNGIFATVTLNSVFDRLWINGTRNGLYLWNNCYQDSSHNLVINTSGTTTLGRIGLANIGQSGVNQFSHLRVNGGPYPLVNYEGSMLLDMLEVAQQSNTVYGAFFKATGDSTVTLNSPIIDVEAGGTSWLGALVFSNIGAAVANGGEIDSTNSAPAVIVDGGGSLSLLGNRMSLSGTPPAAIHVVNPPSQKIAVIEPVTIGLGSAPLSDLRSSTVTLNKEKLDGVSVNGVPNVKAYGEISGSAQNTTGTISAGSTTLTLAAARDFANGQGIAIAHAGAADTQAAPTISSVTNVGATGSTTYNYKVAALDGAGGESAASAQVSTTTGNATLSSTNYNVVSTTPVAGVESYAVYRNNALIGFAINSSGNGHTTADFYDKGQAALGSLPCVSATPPSSALADTLNSTITSGGGTTTLTLSASATTAATSQAVYHDDSIPIQAAINAAGPAGDVYIPVGAYYISSSIVFKLLHGVHAYGAGSNRNISSGGTQIVPSPTLAGLPVVSFVNSQQSGINNLSIYGSSTAPPIAAIESRATALVPYPTHLISSHLYLLGRVPGATTGPAGTSYGIAWTADPGSDDQNDESDLSDISIDNMSVAAYYTGHSNSLLHRMVGGVVINSSVLWLSHGGSVNLTGTISSVTDTQFWLRAGTQYHSSNITSVQTEDTAQILRIDSGVSSPILNFVGYEKNSNASNPTNIIDVQGDHAVVTFTGCSINRFDNPNWTAQFTATNSTTTFANSVIGLNTISYAGNLGLIGNTITDSNLMANLTALNSTAALSFANNNSNLLSGGSTNLGLTITNGGIYTKPIALGNVGGTTICTFNFGNECDMTLINNITLTMRNTIPALNAGQLVLVKISQDAVGGHTVTWPSNAKFPGGTAPTVTATANKTDVFTFISDGTNFYAAAPPAQNQ